MKLNNFCLLLTSASFLVSCASQSGGDDYDVSNPYAVPDYTDNGASPIQPTDVNPTYDSPAVYEDTTPAPIDTAPPVPSAPARVHTVVSGDSLWVISKKYGVTIDAIKQANGMTKDVVVLGSKLKIPAQ